MNKPVERLLFDEIVANRALDIVEPHQQEELIQRLGDKDGKAMIALWRMWLAICWPNEGTAEEVFRKYRERFHVVIYRIERGLDERVRR